MNGRSDSICHLGQFPTAGDNTISHAWCEEVFLISGSLSIGVPGEEEQRLTAGSYAVRPANIPHGPFFSEEGCLMIEFSYYPPKAPMHSSDD